MQCAARGLVAFAWIVCKRAVWLHSRGALRCTGCDAQDAMRGQVRCELVAFAGAGGAMLLTMGKSKGWVGGRRVRDGWAEDWVDGWAEGWFH